MASPVPKHPEQRRRRAEPSRGEWVDLVPLERRVLPEADESWPARTKALWLGWCADPVTGLFGESEVAQAVEAAWLHAEYMATRSAALITESRRRAEALGLSPKGKRDLRYRVAEDVSASIPHLGGKPDAELRQARARLSVVGA